MKLKKENVESIDLVSEELEAIKHDGEDFWGSIRELLRYGIPSHDEKGHSNDLRIRVRPIQTDIISGIREKMPEGWFKNQAALHRSIVAVGCKTIFKLLEAEGSEWHEVLSGIGQISKQQRLEEFRQDMRCLKGKILDGSMGNEEKGKVIDLVSRLEKKIVNL